MSTSPAIDPSTREPRTEHSCKTCGALHSTSFCPDCGEKRVSSNDYSITHFAENVVEVFTNFDFKVFRSLKTLVFRPGLLTADYLEGRRKPHVGPVQLFVIVNIAFFVIAGLVHLRVFNQSLRSQIEPRTRVFGNLLDTTKRRLVDEQIARRGITFQEFEREFDGKSDVHAKSLVFTMIPVLAAAVALVSGPRRRYFFEHLVFATHLMSFYLVFMMAFLPILVIVLAAVQLFGFAVRNIGDPLAALLIVAGMTTYLCAACRRVYGGHVTANLLRSIALSVALLPMLQLYRLLLFFVVLNSSH